MERKEEPAQGPSMLSRERTYSIPLPHSLPDNRPGSHMANTSDTSNPKSQFERDLSSEEDIEDEGEPLSKNLCSLEVSQKIKQDPLFYKADEPAHSKASGESHISSHKNIELYQRLHTEELKKFNSRCGSPMTRKDMVERQEIKECVFKPALGSLTQALAEKRKNRIKQMRIEDTLLDDARKRWAYKLGIEHAMRQESAKEAEKPKISEKSYNIAREKLEKDINAVIAQVDAKNWKQLTFDMLGQFMHLIGVYKILYNKKYGLHSKPSTGPIKCGEVCNHSNTFLSQQGKENEFHMNLWKILNISYTEYISSELLKELMLLLYDSNYVPITILAEQIEVLLSDANESYNAAGGYGEIEKKIVKYTTGVKREKGPTWTPTQLIKAFKALNQLSFSASSAKWFKSREIAKVQSPAYPFAPAINPQSQVLAEAHLKKYLETSLGSTFPLGLFDDDADCNMHEIADEREYSIENSPKNSYPERSRSGDGRSACSPNTSTSITISGKVDTRIRVLFDKRRRSLDKIEQIRAEERRKIRQVCTFKPMISNYCSQHEVSSAFKHPRRKKNNVLSYEERALAECTFKPKITRFERSLERSKQIPRGNRSPSPRLHTMHKKEKVATKDVVLEVTIRPGKKGNMMMRKGETPSGVARKFADKYGLNKDTEVLLKSLLEKELTGTQHN